MTTGKSVRRDRWTTLANAAESARQLRSEDPLVGEGKEVERWVNCQQPVASSVLRNLLHVHG